MKHFTSTSRNPNAALSFQGSLLELQTLPSTSAIVTSLKDTDLKEYETLLDYGQSIEIMGIGEHNGRQVIQARMVDSSTINNEEDKPVPGIQEESRSSKNIGNWGKSDARNIKIGDRIKLTTSGTEGTIMSNPYSPDKETSAFVVELDSGKTVTIGSHAFETSISKMINKEVRKKPKWAQDHGLEFNEEHHRWMKPGTDEPHPHPENDSRWDSKEDKHNVGDVYDSPMGMSFTITDINEEGIVTVNSPMGTVSYTPDQVDGLLDAMGAKKKGEINTEEKPSTDKKEDKVKQEKPKSIKNPIPKKVPEKIPGADIPGQSKLMADKVSIPKFLREGKRNAKIEEKNIKNTIGYVSLDDNFSLMKYVGGAISISASVEKGKPNSDAKKISRDMKPLGEVRKLYRGIEANFLTNDLGEEAQIGNEIILKNFTSTSRDPDFSYDWAHKDQTSSSKTNPIFMEIETTEDTRGINISNSDSRKFWDNEVEEPDQYETLLGYNQKIQVTGKREIHRKSQTNSFGETYHLKPTIVYTCKMVSSS